MKTYKFQEVVIVVAGVRVTGYTEDGGLRMQPASEKVESRTDGDTGEVTRSINPSKLWTGTLAVQMSSQANDLLTAAMQGKAVGPLLVKDLNGTLLISSDKSYLANWPSEVALNRSGDAGFEWPFHAEVEDTDCFIGGALAVE